MQLKSWLMWSLARLRRGGIAAGVKVVSAEGARGGIERFGAIYSWLKRSGEEELVPYSSVRRRIELSGHLSRLFVSYEKYGIGKGEGWQRECFREVVQEKREEWVDRVYCFGCDFLPEKLWESLYRVPSLSIYLFSPCVHFWEDLCTHWEKKKLLRKGPVELGAYLLEAPPLLANWGKLGRETLKILDRFPLEVEERYTEETGESALERLRKSLLHFERVEEIPADSSIQIFQTSSRWHEVELLKENIERLYREGVPFSEMLVLAPEIDSYAPLIEFVFEGKIPYRITAVSTQKFPRLFQLIGVPFEDKILLEFYTAEKRERVALWLELGLDTVAQSFVFANEEEEIGWADADLLEELLEKRAELQQDLQAGEKTWGEWAAFIEQLSKKYSLEQPRSLQELREASGNEKFPVEALLHVLQSPSFEAVHPACLHGVCFGSLRTGAVVPARAIFLIGMDGDRFPRREAISSLDLLRQERRYIPRAGDSDRYLMLQVLFGARERLYVSYSQEGVSLVVQELIGDRVEVVKRNAKKAPLLDYFRVDEPFPDLPEGKITVHLRDLAKLARHPWEFYLHKVLGVFPEKGEIDSFGGLRTYLTKEKIRKGKIREEKLPPGCLGKCLEQEIAETEKVWREQLEKWNLQLSTWSLMKTCREKRSVSAEWVEVPAVIVSVTEKLRVEIIGELEGMSERGWVTTGDEVGPEAWVGAKVSGGREVFFLKRGKVQVVEDAEENLREFLVYYFRALVHMPPLKKSYFEDPVADWVLSRSAVPPEEKLKEKWSRPFCA